MSAPIVTVTGENIAELNVQKGDLIEVTLKGSARGSFKVEIIDKNEVTKPLTDSELNLYYLNLPDGANGLPFSTNAIFEAVKAGTAKFQLDINLCYQNKNYQLFMTSLTARILPNFPTSR